MNYKIIIDGKPFTYNNQVISGMQIRKIGNLPKEAKVWFKINKFGYKLEINFQDAVDLTRQGPEEFFTNV